MNIGVSRNLLPRRSWARFLLWADRVGFKRKLALALTLAALMSGISTYLVMTGARNAPSPATMQIFLVVDIALLLFLGGMVAQHIVRLMRERRRGALGSRLKVRFVLLFSVVAVTPAIFMAVFSGLFFNLGVEAWFSARVRTALTQAQQVAQAYLGEHRQAIAGDVLAMANDINRIGPRLLADPRLFNQVVATQATARGLVEAVVFRGDGQVLARSAYAYSLQFGQVPFWAIERARQGEVAVLAAAEDRVRALVQIQSMEDTYLYVGRFVDPKVVAAIERTQAAVSEYQRLEGQRSGLETTFSVVFGVVALLLLMVAIWVGVNLASKLARPIAGLIDAAEKVGAGDLTARVAESETQDEIGSLSRAFNRMTGQLDSQRRDLVDANRELDERRRFTETVLAGVSAGVIGLDAEGRINLPNRSAAELLGIDLEERLGAPLGEVIPEMDDLLASVYRRPDRIARAEIKLAREGQSRTLLVRIASERLENRILGFVVTFDDVSELLAAQRKAAWADVARRIAHEIKNPLTPIQLAAERLKRKYLKEIQSDPETFATCTETIVRQVGDIGRMVDEFSDFARMPAPVFRSENVKDILRQAVFLQREGNTEVDFSLELPDHPMMAECDSRLIGQALTNLLKNAIEAIQGRETPADGQSLPKGRIVVQAATSPGGQMALIIEDNGKGLPKEERERLTEPYVTTRAKGTGLGLAIVKKIMEEHGGDLILEDADPENGGARISLILPAQDSSGAHSTAAANGA